MKERRASGATHSFRLSIHASEIVDAIQHPRRLGGKSAKVSEAIEWYFSRDDDRESIEDLKRSRKFWVERYDNLKNVKDEPPSRGWWARLWINLKRFVPFL